MCFSFFFRELIGQKRKQCGRGQEIEGLPPPPSFSRLTPVQLSSGIPYFTNHKRITHKVRLCLLRSRRILIVIVDFDPSLHRKILLPSHRLFLGVSAEGSLRSTVSTSIASPGGMHCFPLVNEFFGQPTSQSSSTATISLLEKIMNKN